MTQARDRTWQALAISTSHVKPLTTPGSGDWGEADACATEWGWFLYVQEPEEMPPWLGTIMAWCQAHDVRYLVFDEGADAVADFEVFE